MLDLGLRIAALMTSFAGLTLLALSLKVHWQQLFADKHHPKGSQRIWLRLFGASFLLMSMWFCVLTDNTAMAVLVWIMFLALSALLVAMMFAVCSRN